MATLIDTVQAVMKGYTGDALNGHSYLTRSLDGDFLTVTSVGKVRGKNVVNTGLAVRLLPEKVVIEQDSNDKQLVDALLQAGIPRKQIVLAYAGETVEEGSTA